MLSNYIKIALRQLARNRLYALINVIGLAVGLSVYMMAGLIADYESNHDSMFSNRDRIYMVSSIWNPLQSNSTIEGSGTYTGLQPFIATQMPHLKGIARRIQNEFLISAAEKSFYQTVKFVDPDFLKIFDFTYLHGSAASLSGPNMMVVSASFANKVFGQTNVVGQSVNLDKKAEMVIVAVIADIPKDSHLSGEIESGESLEAFTLLENYATYDNNWDVETNFNRIQSQNVLYVMTDGALSDETLNQELNTVFKQAMPERNDPAVIGLKARLLKEANLSFWNEMGIPFIMTLRMLGLLVLAIAVINYSNLATAQNMGRSREVGLRKTLGAGHKELLAQFLVESQAIVMVAMVLALVLVEIAVPTFNQAADKVLTFDYLASLPWLFATTVVVGLTAGAYPAYVILGTSATEALKEVTSKGSKGSMFRSVMLGSQFVITIAMMAMVFVIYAQNEKVAAGSAIFPKDQVIVLKRVSNENIIAKREVLKRELTALPGISLASFSSQVPFMLQNWTTEVSRLKGDTEDMAHINNMHIDYDFIKLYDIPIIAGRDFSRDISSDERDTTVRRRNVLVNRMFSEQLGFNSPAEAVGQSVYNGASDPFEYQIVGVMENRNILGLQNEVVPFMMRLDPRNNSRLSLRLAQGAGPEVIENIEHVWTTILPENPIDWNFLDADFDEAFESMRMVNGVIAGFAILAVTLALFGLFGIAAFMAQKRTREIGLRKVLGAGISQLVRMLILQFSRPVMVAIVIAIPLSYMGAQEYLMLFAERIDGAIYWIIIAGLLSTLLSWGIIAVHAMKIARQNPIKALRYE
jgi:putative ABC transport system permease protein